MGCCLHNNALRIWRFTVQLVSVHLPQINEGLWCAATFLPELPEPMVSHVFFWNLTGAMGLKWCLWIRVGNGIQSSTEELSLDEFGTHVYQYSSPWLYNDANLDYSYSIVKLNRIPLTTSHTTTKRYSLSSSIKVSSELIDCVTESENGDEDRN